MILFVCVSVLLALFYAILMFYYALGWRNIQSFSEPLDFVPITRATVIVPARNEEKNIEILLFSLLKQNYPKDLLEIIIVDDDSVDDTAAIVGRFAKQGVSLIQRKHSQTKNTYKKQAIDEAIAQSNGALVITTDADCIVDENWVRTLVAFQQAGDLCFISSAVTMRPANTLFQKFQSLEFAGLVGIGAAALQHRHPNMCNGANIAYLKEAYYAVNGFQGNDSIPSGDDEFLMHKMFKAFPGKVRFLKNNEAIVYTKPAVNIKEFINQRMRWVSKSTKYENKNITLILLLCYLFNLSLLLNFFGMFFNAALFWLFLFQFILKIITEGILLKQVTRFLKLQNLMRWLIPEQLLHMIYVVVIGVAGNMFTYLWKGRRV